VTGFGEFGVIGRRGAAAILAVVTIVAPAGARAAVFAVLQSTPDVVTVLDPAAIQTVGQTAVRRAWSVSVKKVLTEGGPQQPGYVRTLNEYDCVARQLRWRTFQVYSRFGDLVMKQDNRDDVWSPAPDAGESAAAMKTVCDGSVGGAVIAAGSVSQLVLTLMQAWDVQAPLPPPQVIEPPPKKKPGAKAKARKGKA
jgi:hypothetical protein